VIDRSSGEVFESRSCAEIVLADSDDGRVGVEARNNGVLDRRHDRVESVC
jgi:hypothetical protein